MDEASRLAALLEEDDENLPVGEIDVDQLLCEFGQEEAEDIGGASNDDTRSLDGKIDDILEGPISRLPAEQAGCGGDASGVEGGHVEATTGKQLPSFGGFLSFFKGTIMNTAGEHAAEHATPTQQLGAFAEKLQVSIRKTVGTITTKTDDVPGPVEPSQSMSPPSVNPVAAVGGSLMNFASQVASSIPQWSETVSLRSAVEPPAPSSFPSDDFVEVTDDSKISLWAYLSSAHPVRSVEVKLRPDVGQDIILSLFETIVLSHGLVVKERGSGALVVERSGSGGRWSMVVCKLGVSIDRHRILLLQFFAPSKVALSSSPLSQPSMLSTTVGPTPLGAQLVNSLASALIEGKLTLSSLLTDEEVVVDLDPHYIKDMQAMCAAEMMATLATYAGPLDAYVREQEIRCARLMTMLQPVYARLGLPIPRPHRAMGLTAFPLDTTRPPVAEALLDSARQLLTKVQSQYRKEGVMDVVRRVWKELQDWADEESRARVKRKNQQVASRLRNVEQHAQSLITMLRDQQRVSLGAVEIQLTSAFRAAAGEVVLLDVGATYASRPGRLYVTCSHLWFHSQLLGFSFQRALPLSGLRSVEQASALGLGGKVLCVVDVQGERHPFLITTLTPPDMVDRVVDLVRLTLECWKRQHTPAGDVSKEEEAKGHVAAAEAEAHEGKELAKRLAEVGMADEVASPVPSRQQEAQEAATGTAGSNVEATAVDLAASLGAQVEEVDEALSKLPPSVSASDDADVIIEALGRTDDGSAESGAATAKARSLRSGIQAFLSESHSHSGSKKPSQNEEPLLDFS